MQQAYGFFTLTPPRLKLFMGRSVRKAVHVPRMTVSPFSSVYAPPVCANLLVLKNYLFMIPNDFTLARFHRFTCTYLSRYTPSPGLNSVAPYVPDPKTLDKAKTRVARRVRLVGALLRVIGRKREAMKLELGFKQWDEGNSTKNDILLWFR